MDRARRRRPTSVAPLTALGHGDPAWAAYYDNVVDRLGLHDDLAGVEAGPSRYLVCGWYASSDPGRDPLGSGITSIGAFDDGDGRARLVAARRRAQGVPSPPRELPEPPRLRSVCARRAFAPRTAGPRVDEQRHLPHRRRLVAHRARCSTARWSTWPGRSTRRRPPACPPWTTCASPSARRRPRRSAPCWPRREHDPGEERALEAFQLGALHELDEPDGPARIEAALHASAFGALSGGPDETSRSGCHPCPRSRIRRPSRGPRIRASSPRRPTHPGRRLRRFRHPGASCARRGGQRAAGPERPRRSGSGSAQGRPGRHEGRPLRPHARRRRPGPATGLRDIGGCRRPPRHRSRRCPGTTRTSAAPSPASSTPRTRCCWCRVPGARSSTEETPASPTTQTLALPPVRLHRPLRDRGPGRSRGLPRGGDRRPAARPAHRQRQPAAGLRRPAPRDRAAGPGLGLGDRGRCWRRRRRRPGCGATSWSSRPCGGRCATRGSTRRRSSRAPGCPARCRARSP